MDRSNWSERNYRIHTDAIKDYLIPPELTPEQISYKYANEADMLMSFFSAKLQSSGEMRIPEGRGIFAMKRS